MTVPPKPSPTVTPSLVPNDRPQESEGAVMKDKDFSSTGDPPFRRPEPHAYRHCDVNEMCNRIAALEAEIEDLKILVVTTLSTKNEENAELVTRCHRLEELVREAIEQMLEENGGELFRDFVTRAEKILKAEAKKGERA